VIVGLAGFGKLFTPDILKAMSDGCQDRRPIIMPMSNPTSKMECTAEEAQEFTGGRAIFASGSPQEDVIYRGERIASSQANNMYALLRSVKTRCYH
jgi:malic enzyme